MWPWVDRSLLKAGIYLCSRYGPEQYFHLWNVLSPEPKKATWACWPSLCSRNAKCNNMSFTLRRCPRILLTIGPPKNSTEVAGVWMFTGCILEFPLPSASLSLPLIPRTNEQYCWHCSLDLLQDRSRLCCFRSLCPYTFTLVFSPVLPFYCGLGKQ